MTPLCEQTATGHSGFRLRFLPTQVGWEDMVVPTRLQNGVKTVRHIAAPYLD